MYKIIGSDHKVYGPVSADQIRRWMAEGRVNASTLALAEGSAEWKPLSSFPEFSIPPLVGVPAAAPGRIAPAPSYSRGNSMATAGFVCGVLAIFLFWLCCFDTIFAVLGIIFSSIGLTRAKALPEEPGKGLALTGLILSIIGLLKNFVFALIMALFSAGQHAWPHRWSI